MKIIGQVSSPEEEKEIQFIVKTRVDGIRAKMLALKAKKED